MNKTIFCDIDSTLIKYDRNIGLDLDNSELLPGVREALINWNKKEYNIILTTGRRESLRKQTEEQLSRLGIQYDQLIMGIKGWPRYIINDKKSSGELGCHAINVERNEGLSSSIIEL